MTTTTTNTTPLQITIYPSGSGLPVGASTNNSSQAGFFSSSDGPSFKDVLDTINPLQHIPIISSIYQSMTGDVQSPASKLTGGALFGGPVGFIGSLFDTIFQSATGSDIGTHLIATVTGTALPGATFTTSETAQNTNTEPSFLSANQRAAYNAYVHTQNMMG